MKLKVKLITGFRKDQHFTIEADEAHKAYYLFMNPDKRGVFDSGLALIGQDIRAIEPDYNATMGWNPTYQLGDDDWNELNSSGVSRQLRDILAEAKQLAYKIKDRPELMALPLSEVKQKLLALGA